MVEVLKPLIRDLPTDSPAPEGSKLVNLRLGLIVAVRALS